MGHGMSKKLLIQIGLGSATTAALIYIWFGPKRPPPARIIWEPPIPKPKLILGLHNLGNSCYLNSLLQALAACRHYVTYINKYYELKQLCSKADDNNPIFRVVSALSTSNRYINRDEWGEDAKMSLEIPKIVIATFKGSLATRTEQDTHEIFNTIQSKMIEEQKELQTRPDFLEAVKNVEDSFSFTTVSDRSVSSESGLPSDDNSFCYISQGNRIGVTEILSKASIGTQIVTRASLKEVPPCPSSPADLIDWNNPFVGRVASVLQCIQCLTTMPIKFEEFTDLTLTLPPRCIMPTLKHLISHYFVPTIVHQVDCPTCSATAGKPTKSSFHKKTSVAKFPRSLCLHVNRAEWSRSQNGSNKRFDFIPFAIEMDLGTVSGLTDLFKSESQMSGAGTGDCNGNGIVSHRQSTKYELASVICHRGSVHTGHFVTYRRTPFPANCFDEWYLVSDTVVRGVMEEQVLLQHAYMLFYDRIESDDAE